MGLLISIQGLFILLYFRNISAFDDDKIAEISLSLIFLICRCERRPKAKKASVDISSF